jgi:rfaE bifunctional protein kinase chain/domain
MMVTKATLHEAIRRLSNGRVLVVGDVVIDEMIYGTTARLSREAPVVILNHDHTDIVLGGAGNAVHNIAKLGAARATILGITGEDHYRTLLLDALCRDGIDACGMIPDSGRPTTTKSRVSGIANQSVTQQIVRIDRELKAPVSGALETALLDKLSELAPQFDAILISDYGLGVVTPAVISACQALAKAHNLLVTVDSQTDLGQFQGVAILTPNQPEAENNAGMAFDTPEALREGGRRLLEKTSADNVLITLGSDGMALFEAGGEYHTVPVFNKSEVFDVTGAGDTVIGTLTLAMATGADPLSAAILGNLAASITVKRFGAATTSQDELAQALDDLEESLLETITRSTLSPQAR